MTRSHVPLCSRNSPAPLTGNTGLSLQICVRGNVCTLYKHLSAIPAARSSASLTHRQAYTLFSVISIAAI